MTVNVAKLAGICVGMVCVTVLMATRSIDQAAGASIISGAMFYLIGNGVNARKGKQDVAVIQPRPEGRRADDRPSGDVVEAAHNVDA